LEEFKNKRYQNRGFDNKNLAEYWLRKDSAGKAKKPNKK